MTENEARNIAVIHRARRIMLSGDVGAALSQLASLTGCREFATYRLVRGECYYIRKDFTKAREEFRNAVRLAPNSPRAAILLQLTSDMLELQRTIRPLPGVEELLRERPVLPKETKAKPASSPAPREKDEIGLVSETLANIMTQQGKYEEAKKVFIQLARLNPEHYDYFRQRMDELDERMRG